jgi:hypothetical protein
MCESQKRRVKVGDVIEVIDAKPLYGAVYKNGDRMRVTRLYYGGVSAIQRRGEEIVGLYLLDTEFEVVE